MAEIPDDEYILKTTSACAGCSIPLCLRYITKAAGPDTVLVIPACCTSVIQGLYPNTAVNIPVYNVAFASAAAVASGMSEAFRAAGKKTNVICFAGDGGTVDIGIQALSGALERGTDFLYVCYDNEAYSNTGMQRSGATPLGAATTTTPAGKKEFKKDLDAIVNAHNPVYMATACSAYPLDLYNKVEKALSITGPKFIHILAPCPPGWRYQSDKTISVGKLAVQSGMWVLYERENGKISLTGASKAAAKKRIPVEDYLKAQGRFKTASKEEVSELQQAVENNFKRIEKEVDGTC
ncbi:thiamine pyrophosphate protein domain protein TPP-binding protein [Methanolacinia petrolearia DSM 11571]|uniref:Thiamine pyrophosphate protein domain protein TPP-binding protein n=1 Tax=Methanolacinia petrolearia (strain DSM 11571 / OCM 486 / SEBR 4847) TaxID=679926 RepID=E1RHN3_METP4|nr:thiamine pyrophosphate-dependent enzyme [Methanolacinia petrolearia]ADN35342.1 thiamine pyrophosphate protein domain protein TPP-binding protein [Methanolacinia petrolearia DSM 11571]